MSEFGIDTGAQAFVYPTAHARKERAEELLKSDEERRHNAIAAAGTAGAVAVGSELEIPETELAS